MKKNSKISVAIHALIHILKSSAPQTSEDLAKCFGTNPVVIRRILGSLKKYKIVNSEKGHGGGWVLLKTPQEISLYDIYKALDESLLPAPEKLDKNEKCLIVKTMMNTMDDFFSEASTLLDQKLKKVTIKTICDEMKLKHNI